jgi:hypothetical protein
MFGELNKLIYVLLLKVLFKGPAASISLESVRNAESHPHPRLIESESSVSIILPYVHL